jgi:hypothetical protein
MSNIRTLSVLGLVGVVLIMSACAGGSGRTTSGERVMVAGRIEPAQMTSFMYGSHLLYDQSGRLTHALTSDGVDLSEYEGQQVIVRGVPVDGYPVDGGPPYLRVTDVGVPTE